MIHTITIKSSESLLSKKSYPNKFWEKYDKWIIEEYNKGWIIEVLRIDYRNQQEDLNCYWDIEYRSWKDPIHEETEERLKIGL